MKISYNWLKDYVAIKLSPEKLSERLTMLGLEVVSWEKLAGDVIFEIEITANRPDCLNVIGICREISAATGQKLKIPSLKQKAKAAKRNFIQVQDKDGCPLYIGKIITGVKVGPAPDYIQKRLKGIGLRPVNNIVDITNYLLLELGQPMHAFDLDKLREKRIIVRRAKSGEDIVTIDGQERKLDPDCLVIADAQKPVAIAGIMGGKASEVNDDTKNILLESAYFNPLVIRRVSRKLGLISESAYRFERSVDIPLVEMASNRVVTLLLEHAGGKLSAVCHTAKGKTITAAKWKTIELDGKRVSRILGQDIASAKIKTILGSLGLKVNSGKGGSLKVAIPSFRLDLKEEVDLIEEIARHIGFDRLPISLPAVRISDIPEQPLRKLSTLVRDILVAIGLNEVITYALINRDSLQNLGWRDFSPVEIKNPLSQDQEIMRPVLLPGMLSVMRNNLNHGIEEVKIFEIGKIYQENQETTHLSIGLMAPQSTVSLLDLKGMIEALFKKLCITDTQFSKEAKSFFTPQGSFAIAIKGKPIGCLGELAFATFNNLDFKPSNIFLAQINLEAVLEFVKWAGVFKPLINFPQIRRDISLIIKDEVSSGRLIEILKEEAGPLLIDILLTDRYSGEQIPRGFKGLTYSLTFQAPDRTLSDAEINSVQQKLCGMLEEKLAAKIRR